MAKILIADDDEDIRYLVEYNLVKEGFEVITAKNGIEGFELSKEHRPELVILDIMMPEMDGVELCEKMRSMPEFDNTLIVFLTARTEDFTQIACYENGGDDYIVKPVKPKILVSRINAILRRSRIRTNSQSDTIELGDIVVDIEKYNVSKSGSIVELAKKEFELLTLLISKPGKLFTRDEIFNKVWGVDNAIGDRTIDVHIRKLREKLGQANIKTIKGLGYKFEII